MRQMVKYIEKKRDSYGFYRSEKAYDRVPREVSWSMLGKKKVVEGDKRHL